MTCCAFHRRKNFIVVGMFHGRICVATDAGICPVSRGGELCLIDEQGNCLSRGIGSKESIVGVAVEAVVILHAGGHTGGCKGKEQSEQWNQIPSDGHSVIRIFRKAEEPLCIAWRFLCFFAVRDECSITAGRYPVALDDAIYRWCNYGPPVWQSLHLKPSGISSPGCLKAWPWSVACASCLPLPWAKMIWHWVQSLKTIFFLPSEVLCSSS